MLLGSDYDGTLTYGGITDEKCDAIHRWRAAGNLFGIISGRNAKARQAILKAHPRLELDFFACFSGGTILDSEGNILYETLCRTVDTLQLAKDLLEWGCPFVHLNSDIYRCIVRSVDDKPKDVEVSDVYLVDNTSKIDAFHQVSVRLDTVEAAKSMVDLIKSTYGDRLDPLQNGLCVDIVPLGVNKAKGLYKVMEIFGCCHRDVIAVGDNLNDMDMLRAFRSYAMENAPDEVKRIADSVTSGVDALILFELEKRT